MVDAMSKKEKLARGSAVIKVMRVNPRPGHFLKTYIDPRKIPKAPKVGGPKGVLAEMPHLDVKNAIFEFAPSRARIPGAKPGDITKEPPCGKLTIDEPSTKISTMGLPDGDILLDCFGYRTWAKHVSPADNGNLACHFNIMLGLLISMATDKENESFPDVEAYPCIQFLRTIKTPDGETPYNVAGFISYIEYVAQKMLDEG